MDQIGANRRRDPGVPSRWLLPWFFDATIRVTPGSFPHASEQLAESMPKLDDVFCLFSCADSVRWSRKDERRLNRPVCREAEG